MREILTLAWLLLIKNEIYPVQYNREYAAESEITSTPKRKTGRLYRRKMTKKKEKELKDYVMRNYYPSAGWCKYSYIEGRPVATGHLKYPKTSRRQRFLKRVSNRALRRGNTYGSGKGGYRRVFDYWWELY